MAVIIVAEYIIAWMVDSLKLGEKDIDRNEPLSQQLWLCVAKENPIDQGKMTKSTDAIGISVGQQKIPLKIINALGEGTIEEIQLRYLIGCVSVLSDDGVIYQYQVPADSTENELKNLELFGYVYTKPFASNEQALLSIVEGRKLQPAKRDQDGNILTRFQDIVEHAKAYADQNHEHHKSVITTETAHQVAQILCAQKFFVNANDVKEQFKKAQETIELSVDVLREDIQEKTKFYQLSIDAAHEQIKKESEANRETMKKDNEMRYEQSRRKLDERMKTIETRLEQLIAQGLSDIKQQMEQKAQQILEKVENAETESHQAIAEANQATQISQKMLEQATQAAASAKSLVELVEQERQQFQAVIKNCEAKFKETAAQQKEFCERTISELRTKVEKDSERVKEAAKDSATSAKQSLSRAQDVQRTTKEQLELQKNETKKTIAEAQETNKRCDRAADEAKEAQKQAKRAADACTEALSKVNGIEGKVEKVLKRKE